MQSWNSSIKHNTLKPIFNEAFHFNLQGKAPVDSSLEILVLDYDRYTKDDETGVVYIGTAAMHYLAREHWRLIFHQPNIYISYWHPIIPVGST